MKKFSILLLLTSLLFVACKDKPAPEPEKDLSLAAGQTTELQFGGYAESRSVRFNSDLNWMIQKSNSDWFEVSPMYGNAGQVTITVSVEDYVGETTLNGTFSIVAGEKKIDFTVTQISANNPESDNVYIPDATFASYLVGSFDSNRDGKISKSEAAAVKEINCSDMGITSIEGIKNFTALEVLDCSRNVIEGVLDLSGMANLKEAYLHHNLYSKIDLSGCSELRIVEANDNVEHTPDFRSIFRTTEVDLTGCSELLYLELTDNGITSLDLSDCTKLQVLRATWNDLGTIDVSMCPDMTHLYVRKNPNMTGVLDLTNNANLVEVWCAETKLEGVTFAAQQPELTRLVCYDSNIESLDLTKCPALVDLQAHSMKLTSIDLTACPELESVWLKFNEIGALDVTACPELVDLEIGYNQVKTLDLSNNTKLVTLEVVSNGLESINLANCRSLQTVNLSTNKLQDVDLTDCVSLFQINLNENELTELTVKDKEELGVLSLSNNQVVDLNISNLPLITLLYADHNKIEKLDLREFTYLQELSLCYNELTDLRVDGLIYLYLCEFNNNNLERIDLSGCVSISELYVQQTPMAYLSVYDCAGLRQLDMRKTQMKSIDLSNNPAAAFLFATENPQLETVFIMETAEFSTLSVDDHVEVFYRAPGYYDDVNNDNWGDEDINPWASNEAA